MTAPAEAVASRTRLREFEVDRVLGAGGFGITYLARDTMLDRLVAIKEYFPRTWGRRCREGAVGPRSPADSPNYRWGLAKFVEEARALARLDHPQIVRVHRVIKARGTAYLVMEYVEGESLAQLLAAGGPMPEARVRPMLESLAHGLAAVHAAGLLHRDVKPTNVMMRPDGTPVLIDFGAAQLRMRDRSRSLRTVLTPGYAPIERYRSGSDAGREGPWTDIYGLGALGYAALTGRVPLDAVQRACAPSDTLPTVAAAGPVSRELAAAIDAGLKVHACDRPKDIGAWLSLLRPGVARPRRKRRRVGPRRRRGLGAGRADGTGLHDTSAFTVGRHPTCDVVLDDVTVSGRHAEVTWSEDGRVRITDRGSTNGTFVLVDHGWRPVGPARLDPSDRVRFGNCEVAVSRLRALCRAARPQGSR